MPDGHKTTDISECKIEPSQTAFFFDFDGTLAPIIADPEAVSIDPEVLETLNTIQHISHGAMAIVSGRSIAALDQFLHPLKLPAAGVHGLERRDAAGTLHTGRYDQKSMVDLQRCMTEFGASHDGLIAEIKPGSVALHYRQRPDLADACIVFAETLSTSVPGVSLMHGKMVLELRLGGRNKADAVAAFMAEPSFLGRTPLFAGDDVTDEDAFIKVTEMGGAGIKIGEGETAARWRAKDIYAFHHWLIELAYTVEDRVTELNSGGQNQKANQGVEAETSTDGPALRTLAQLAGE